MIQTVIFDLGGVIVPLDFGAGYQRLEQVCPFRADEIPDRIRASGLVQRFETGRIEPETFYRELSGLLRIEVDYAEFRQLWCAIFPPHALFPAEWIETVRRQKRVVLLSNTNAIHFEIIRERYPHLAHFDDFVLSYEAGVMKPEAEIYRRAIEAAGCAPGECFFTDDVMPYVSGAREAGIDAEQFLGAEKLRADLAARGISVEP